FVVDRLRPDHFFEPDHRRIYEVMLDLYTQGGRISYTQVYRRLRKEGALDAPDQALIGLTEAFANEVELGPSVDVLIEKGAKRKILQAAQEIQRMILEETEENLDDTIARAQQLIFQATSRADESEDVKDLMSVLNKCYLRLVERRE